MLEQHRAHERRVFQAIDLDRTLLNTGALEQKLRQVAKDFDPQLSRMLEQESDAFLARGESFPIFHYLQQQLGDQYSAYVEQLRQQTAPQDILNDGATERLAFAEKQATWSGGILTYGDEAGQRLKLELTGLRDYPHMITPGREKGGIMASWQQSDGTYQLPEEFGAEVVDIVTLDDDKLAAFQNFPANKAFGVWLTSRPDAEAQIPVELADRVTVARNLFESMQRLEAFLTTE